MSSTTKLSSVWLKASVLGCLWAASEIVLGSFLHNLRVPFTGNIMTGTGIILLVSVGYLWDEKGLFWRAGFICALMKSISPGAVIFGPMIAICCEAFLLEFSVRIIGRNMAGFIIGGMFAMLWNLVQFILNFIFFYGVNIVSLYQQVSALAEKRFNIQFAGGWMPVIALVALYMLLGLIAALTGIYIGRNVKKHPPEMLSLSTKEALKWKNKSSEKPFRYSLLWLVFTIAAMISALCLISFCKTWIWVTAGSLMIIIWSIRYKNSLRILKKPGFWITFFIITLLMGWLYSGIRNGNIFSSEGIIAGLQVNFRAALMIIGFAATGRELINPVIKDFFSHSKYKQPATSLEVAFDTLPLMISNLPRPQEIFRNPLKTMKQLVSQADTRLEKISLQYSKKPFVIFISGRSGTGKTSMVLSLIKKMKADNLSVAGFAAPSVCENGKFAGHNIYDITTGQSNILARKQNHKNATFVGKYYITKEGMDTGNKILINAAALNPGWIVIDEIGPWELTGQGWAKSINKILETTTANMIWVVREGLVNEVISGWNIKEYRIYKPSDNMEDEISGFIRLRMPVADIF